MFGLFEDVAKGIGNVVGTVAAVPLAAAAIALGLGSDMVNAAIESGCTTLDEIIDFCR